MRLRALGFFLTALLAATAACQSPPVPPEVEKAEAQSLDLRKAGAQIYFPDEYDHYVHTTRKAKTDYFKMRARFVWFRKYDKTAEDFRSLLDTGNALLQRVAIFKNEETESFAVRAQILRSRIKHFRQIGILIRDGRFTRSLLIKAEILIGEGESLLRQGAYGSAGNQLSRAESLVDDSMSHLMSLLERYNDPRLLSKWSEWLEDTLRVSRKEGTAAIVITKIDQTLALYRSGRLVRSFSVSIGRDGLFDKKHAGDYATPEGRYRISRKNSASLYHKALIIDYPNASDRTDYDRNQRSGLIPSGVGIGGRIEIHGGGSDIITDGCVSMTDEEIDLLFDLVEVGTPVTIIGSTKSLKLLIEGGNGH